MEQDQQPKKRVKSKPRNRPTDEDLRNMLKKLQKMMDKLGYGLKHRPAASPARCQAAVASAPAPAPASSSAAAPSDSRGLLKRRINYDQYEVPVFNTYEEFHKKVLQSLENISVVLNINGKVVFVSQNVSPLLGHRPEDIVGKSLLNILLDEEKEEIAQKIVLSLPLAKSVGKLIEFCCYVRKGNAGPNTYDDKRHTFEYVKFILYLQDSYDESFVFFGNYGPNSKSIWSSSPKLLWEQQYYLVGTISVLRKTTGSARAVAIQPEVIVIDSDDDDNIQYQRIAKPRKRNKVKRKCQAENLNMECESVTDVEIVDIQPATQQMPFELDQVRAPSRSSTCTNVSMITSMSPTTSISSTECEATESCAFGQESMIDPKFMLEPVDIEFEVPPEFLLNDSEDERSSPKQGCSNEDMRKSLEEAKGPNPKEHVIDEALGASSDEYFCVIAENTEVKKGPKIQEHTVGQGPGNQKTAEKAPKCSSTAVKPVRQRPEAVVEPIMRTDLPSSNVAEPGRALYFQRQLLGERFAQLQAQQVQAQTYDMSTNRSFNEEPPSYRYIEEQDREQEQCEYELAQRIEMLRNMAYERPMAQQMRQEQENPEYLARDQMVTVINDARPLPINFYGNDNSEYLRNETHRSWDNCAERSSVWHLPSTRSWQRPPMPHRPVAVTLQPLAVTNNPLTVALHTLTAVSHHSSARSSLTTSDNRRENGLHFLPSSQENPDYFQAEEDIYPHP